MRLDDISCFIANWDDKATNLNRIATDLNIGLNSIVFLDDNPVERSIVRQRCPEVAVPELPEDPAEYIEALDRMAYFETAGISNEDIARTSYYQSESVWRSSEELAVDLQEFLQSLKLEATILSVSSRTIERTAQLISRSNQFNVTTRRYTSADLMAMAASDDWITMTISLRDRFGDNGLISVILARIDRVGKALVIDTWLISCRVLKREVENLALNVLVKRAAALGLNEIRAEYIPTAKNGLVKNLFAALGFQSITQDGNGHSLWRLPLHGFSPLTHQIIERGMDA